MKRFKQFIGIVLSVTLAISSLVVNTGAAPVSTSSPSDPVIMSFDGIGEMHESGTRLEKFNGNESGKHITAPAPDGTPSVKLMYSPHENGWQDYRMMPTMTAGKITDAHNFVRVTYYTECGIPASITVINNAAPNEIVVLEDNTAKFQGKWVTSDPVNINIGEIRRRYTKGWHCSVGWNCISEDELIYIKEIAFFTSEAQAYAYYGETPKVVTDNSYSALTFGAGSDSAFYKGDSFGVYSVNEATKSVDIVYADTTNHSDNHYMAKVQFTDRKFINPNRKFVRVLYAADHPTGVDSCVFEIVADGFLTNTVIESDVKDTNGKFVLSDTVLLDENAFARFSGTREYETKVLHHNSLQFSTQIAGGTYKVKAIYFFETEEAAAAFGSSSDDSYSTLTFGDGGNSRYFVGGDFGNYTTNATTKAVDIVYADKTNHDGNHYMAKVQFANKNDIKAEQKYVRVFYAAQHPVGVDTCSLDIVADGFLTKTVIEPDVKNTNGEFVLSKTVALDDNAFARFSATREYETLQPHHNSIQFSTSVPGGTYSVKAIYFFSSEKAANEFNFNSSRKLTINGNDISKYKIVVPKDTPIPIELLANRFAGQILTLSGFNIPIVTDETAASEYEIRLGISSRDLTKSLLDGYSEAKGDYSRYVAKLVGNTVVITGFIPSAVYNIGVKVCNSFLYGGVQKIPEEIDVNSALDISGKDTYLTYYPDWSEIKNVADPEIFTADFSTDDGYFTEDYGADDFRIKNGALSADADDLALTYIHVYEKNVVCNARLKYQNAKDGADFGLVLRYNAEDAWVKAGYDTVSGSWYIKSREGADYYLKTEASVKAALSENTWYDLEFEVDGTDAKLTVNGKTVLSASDISHVSPGRIGVYAGNVKLTVDSVNAKLLSGQGTVWKNVYKPKVEKDILVEGSSALEMTDGSVLLMKAGSAFKSTDNGRTWQSTTPISTPVDSVYHHIIRLNDGNLLKIDKADDKIVSYTSADDGKTWVRGGVICNDKYNGTIANALNMNDKVTQSAKTGRIFFSQNYDTGYVVPVDEKFVFCEFFYSDDNGKTWVKSETDSWTIQGNEKEAYFGECKILECDDGTIRMYNSWNDYGCVVYSESKDGGKTFGPLVKLPEIKCARSSMQFVRDPYAENDSTYYMVTVNTQDNIHDINIAFPRATLSLYYSLNGKDWTYLGDVWRWQNNYMDTQTKVLTNHVIDPFITVTEDYVYTGSGIAEFLPIERGSAYHGVQQQHVWVIDKNSLVAETLYGFTDVDTNDSYYDAVKFVVDKGLFNGTSETTFSPNETMTRAMFVTVLGRLSGADTSKYTKPTFSDVKAGQWYTSYVEWAAANGIVNGMGNGIFDVNGKITVEQACIILARYSNYAASAKPTGKALNSFSDGDAVSDWAKREVEWAIANGIYEGAGSLLDPTAPAARSLVATMFANYVKQIG